MNFEMCALNVLNDRFFCADCSDAEPNSFKRLVQFSVAELECVTDMKALLKSGL